MPPKPSIRSSSLRPNGLKQEGSSRSSSVYCHYGLNKQFYCGSILEIIRFWQREKLRKTRTETLRLENLPPEPVQPLSGEASLRLEDSLVYSTVVQQPVTTFQNKNVFRVKLLYRGESSRHEECKEREVEHISSLNVETKRMSSRGNRGHPIDRSPQKMSRQVDSFAHTFYRLQPAQQVSIRKTSVTNEQEAVIGPW